MEPAERLAQTSAETEFIAESSVPSPRPSAVSSSIPYDEGRFLPGTMLAGRYRVAGLLGKGGMGEVYRATDLTLGQAVALKILPEALSRDERALARFFNEVRVARQVTHPNVCRVYDIGFVEGLHYISMEFVDGEDLSSLLRRIGRLPQDKAVETARKLCAGLAAAHDRGVLHRDLKPANIMIDGRGQVIIMDFGLAGLQEQVQGDVRSGTPAYMSPEQLSGTGVTVKSDIYALGLVLYELFTGKRAFDAPTVAELQRMQQAGTMTSLSSAVKDIDPDVERIIERCLSPDPAQRPSSAMAVAGALPGGNLLEAALAAGETPSPELVAAAGETEGLSPKVALAWLGAALILVLAVAMVSASEEVQNRVRLDLPPEALAYNARGILSNLGYPAKPADVVYGFDYNGEYRNYLKTHPAEAAEAWRDPSSSPAPVILFWYREASQPMAAQDGLNAKVKFDDPPMTRDGTLRMELDPTGKLVFLEAVTPQVEKAQAERPLPWEALFRAAGLDLAQFQTAPPEWTPLTSWDQRAAWTKGNLRIEAAAWRGLPVSFRIIGPWTVPERSQPHQRLTLVSIGFSCVILLSAGAFTWWNIRSGKVDFRGARYIGLLYSAPMFAAQLLLMHHTATVDEFDLFWRCVAVAGINAGIVYLLYLALEPWVRRRWPQTMISWNRFVVKGIRDPLVGRDILYAIAVTSAMLLLGLAKERLSGPSFEPSTPNLVPLNGFGSALASMLVMIQGINGALSIFFSLFLLRVLLRNQWLAIIAYIVVMTGLNLIGGPYTWMAILYQGIVAATEVWLLLRVGMLGTIAALVLGNLQGDLPHTLDFSSWYAGPAWVPVLVVLGFAIFAFRNALGNRRLLPGPEAL
jgi:serine/threonine-protein kinase